MSVSLLGLFDDCTGVDFSEFFEFGEFFGVLYFSTSGENKFLIGYKLIVCYFKRVRFCAKNFHCILVLLCYFCVQPSFYMFSKIYFYSTDDDSVSMDSSPFLLLPASPFFLPFF